MEETKEWNKLYPQECESIIEDVSSRYKKILRMTEVHLQDFINVMKWKGVRLYDSSDINEREFRDIKEVVDFLDFIKGETYGI